MVDNRSAGFYGIGGSFNFKGGDISGTAAKNQDDKMGQGTEYFAQDGNDDEQNNQQKDPYVDRSAQLRATLNSLAMMNVANVINTKKRRKTANDNDLESFAEDDLEPDKSIDTSISDFDEEEEYI